MQMTDKGGAISYAKPTEKPQFGKPGAQGTEISEYNLPAIDVQSQRRNFPGYTDSQPFSLDDLRQGDPSGTTDTDSDISDEGDKSRTKIYDKQGPKDKWPNKRS